jgi:hypothetical protein
MNSKLQKFLKLIKLTAETATAVIPFFKMLLVAAGAMAVALLISANNFAKKKEDYLAEMRTFKQQADKASKYADSLAAEIAREYANAREAETRASAARREAETSKTRTATLARGLDSLRATITDSIEMARVIIPTQDSIIREQSVTIGKQDSTISHLLLAGKSKDTVISLLTVSRDSLQRVVNLIPLPPKERKILGMALPSRTVVFIAGVMTGTVVASKVR